jgi:hypothetical protein
MKVLNNKEVELRTLVLEYIYQRIDELKNSENIDSKKFRNLLELAEIAGNNANVSAGSAEEINDFLLVKGVFDTEDANNILAVLYNSKIDFHVRAALSHELRNGFTSQSHAQRICELQDSYNKVKELIALARNCNMKIRINAPVDIELIAE